MKRKAISKDIRQEVYAKYDGHCAYCGKQISLPEMQIDHIVPVYLGGEDSIANYNPACRSCNHYKSTLTVEKFRKEIASIESRLAERNTIYKIAKRFGVFKYIDLRIHFYFENYEENNV